MGPLCHVWGGPRPDALSQDVLLFARFDYAYPLVGVEVEVGLPSTERTLQGPGGCRAFVGRNLACGVFGMSLLGYEPYHQEGACTTALDRTRATHVLGMRSIGACSMHYTLESTTTSPASITPLFTWELMLAR